MKLRSLFAALFLGLISIGFVSCSKSEKDKVIDAQKLVLEWIKSDNLIPDMKAKVKNPGDLNKYMDEKGLEIAKKAGFKDMEELEKISKKYENDADVKKLVSNLQEVSKTKFQEIMKFQMELMQAEQPMMSAPDQNAPAPEEPAK